MTKTESNISFFDKSYQKNNAANYKLYAEVSYSGIKLTVLDMTSESFIGFEHHLFDGVSNDFNLSKQLSEYVIGSETFNQSYKAIIIAVVNNRSTLVPNAIYKPESLESYHQFNFT